MPYHALFVSLWLILASYWTWGFFGNKRTSYRWSPRWRILGIVVFIGFVAFAHEYPPLVRRIYPPSPAKELAGIAICAAGVALAIWARRTLGGNWSGGPTIKEGHELVTAGPYRLARHPIYTGFLLAIVGTALGSGKPRDLIILAVALPALWIKLSIEERLMTRQFPREYPDYKKRTKALIPFVL